ncbi:outer membrane beta-barrel protein [Pontibacter locisalis]|uniref:Outer membrane beta-barrel protein n=1 Tax=Pontibacter locisalis TaxID=1719035 RepID=A0ABW5IHY4_9BACT
MSSAANHKRGPLEEEFQRRMHDAEASPSPDLWARIDHDLTLQESKHYKGRMVLYRQLAAACFILFVMAGALLTYHFKADEAAVVASAQPANAPADVSQLAKAEEGPVQQSRAEKELGSLTAPVPAKEDIAYSTQVIATEELVYAIDEESLLADVGRQNKGEEVAPGIAALESSSKDDLSFSTFDNTDGNLPEEKSAFDSLKPFYQTARQAIAAVPPSYSNSFGRTTGVQQNDEQHKSLVELSKSAKEGVATILKKSEDLALALNDNKGSKEEKESDTDSRWTVGMGYAPSYFNQNIGMPQQMMQTVQRASFVANGPDKSLRSSSNMEEARNEFEENTDPAFSYAVEAKAGFKLTKKLRLLAGLGFTQNTSRTKSSYILTQYWFKPYTDERVALPPTTIFLPSLNNNFSTDSLSVDKTDDFYVNYRYRHLVLPVGLQYEGGINKDWFWYTSGGVAANFLVETTFMATNDEVKDVSYNHGDESPFRKVQFSGNVSLGVGKRISNAVSVTAGPEFRGYFNSLLAEPDKALAPQGSPYTIGLNMSVNYDLGRR